MRAAKGIEMNTTDIAVDLLGRIVANRGQSLLSADKHTAEASERLRSAIGDHRAAWLAQAALTDEKDAHDATVLDLSGLALTPPVVVMLRQTLGVSGVGRHVAVLRLVNCGFIEKVAAELLMLIVRDAYALQLVEIGGTTAFPSTFEKPSYASRLQQTCEEKKRRVLIREAKKCAAARRLVDARLEAAHAAFVAQLEGVELRHRVAVSDEEETQRKDLRAEYRKSKAAARAAHTSRLAEANLIEGQRLLDLEEQHTRQRIQHVGFLAFLICCESGCGEQRLIAYNEEALERHRLRLAERASWSRSRKAEKVRREAQISSRAALVTAEVDERTSIDNAQQETRKTFAKQFAQSVQDAAKLEKQRLERQQREEATRRRLEEAHREIREREAQERRVQLEQLEAKQQVEREQLDAEVMALRAQIRDELLQAHHVETSALAEALLHGPCRALSELRAALSDVWKVAQDAKGTPQVTLLHAEPSITLWLPNDLSTRYPRDSPIVAQLRTDPRWSAAVDAAVRTAEMVRDATDTALGLHIASALAALPQLDHTAASSSASSSAPSSPRHLGDKYPSALAEEVLPVASPTFQWLTTAQKALATAVPTHRSLLDDRLVLRSTRIAAQVSSHSATAGVKLTLHCRSPQRSTSDDAITDQWTVECDATLDAATLQLRVSDCFVLQCVPDQCELGHAGAAQLRLDVTLLLPLGRHRDVVPVAVKCTVDVVASPVIPSVALSTRRFAYQASANPNSRAAITTAMEQAFPQGAVLARLSTSRGLVLHTCEGRLTVESVDGRAALFTSSSGYEMSLAATLWSGDFTEPLIVEADEWIDVLQLGPSVGLRLESDAGSAVTGALLRKLCVALEAVRTVGGSGDSLRLTLSDHQGQPVLEIHSTLPELNDVPVTHL